MEVLEVPVKVGLGKDSPEASFYSINNTVPYSEKSYSFDAIRTANKFGGDCKQTDEDCTHVMTDVWLGQRHRWEEEYKDGQLDFLDGSGQVGKISWFVPKFTAERHPFCTSYLNLAKYRENLANIFHRPTSWKDYCDEVSNTGCNVTDGIADRYPEANEGGYFFSNGYRGHFRPTAKNNCKGEEIASECTGHIVNAPCTWSTFVESQAHWNNISLVSDGKYSPNGGYSHSEMIQIWSAANATKSDVIMWWFEPNGLVEMFLGTDAEFTKVTLPTPSLDCERARVTPEDRCSEDLDVRRGELLGSCDNKAHVTRKAIARSLMRTALAEGDEIESPGYMFIRHFNVEDFQVNAMLNEYITRGGTGKAAREVVCEWVADHLDYLGSFVPEGHPRKLVLDEPIGASYIVAICLGGFAVIYVLLISFLMFQRRKEKVFVYAQIQFIYVVLFGLLLVALGAILHAVEPTQVNCTTQVWFVSMGYTCELIPLIIKVYALNRVMNASKKLKRVRIRPSALYAKVIAINFMVAVYVLVWTLLDPPTKSVYFSLKNDTFVVKHVGCYSSMGYWQTLYLIFEGFLVLAASILAFESRTAKAEFNESKVLGLMIYSHFVFSALRVVAYNVFEDEVVALSMSFLLSFDVITAVSIYMIPKFINIRRGVHKKRSILGIISASFRTSETVHQIQLAAKANRISRIGQSMHMLFGPTRLPESKVAGTKESGDVETKSRVTEVVKEVEGKDEKGNGGKDRLEPSDQVLPRPRLTSSLSRGAKRSVRLLLSSAHEIMEASNESLEPLSEFVEEQDNSPTGEDSRIGGEDQSIMDA
jgi:hypothetical protein